jgi:hypothetical protein
MIGVLGVCLIGGCGDETKTQTKSTTSGPGGKTTTEDTSKTTTSGKNPPKTP